MTTDTFAAWRQEFVLELKRRKASGKTIGDALVVVESHLADSGETVPDTFGDPRDYAQSLSLPKETDKYWRVLFVVAPLGLLLPAQGFLYDTVAAITHSQPQISVQLYQLCVVPALLGLFFLVLLAIRHLRVKIKRVLLAALAGVVILLTVLFSTDYMVQLPTWPTFGIAAIMAISGAVLGWWQPDTDPLISPLPNRTSQVTKLPIRITTAIAIIMIIAGCITRLITG